MRYLLILLISLLTIGELSGCGSSVPILKPFKMDIQQGNVVTSKMLLQLKPGMTKSQVRFIMGTPLIVDSFHNNRWDYFYQMRQGGKVIEQRRVILDFEKDALTRVRGDVVPQGTAGAATGEVPYTKSTVQNKEEPGILDKLQFWKSDKKTAPKPLEAPIEAAKPVEAAKPAAPEKSLLDKLKFWKKDEMPVTTPVEAPKEVMPAPAAPGNATTEAPSENAPSVLAVPIDMGTPSDATQGEAPQVETTPIDLPSVEPAKIEPVPVAVPAKIEPVKSEPPNVVAPAPLPIKAVQPMPNSKQDEKMIFRMDKTLKPELLEPEAVPPAPEPVVEQTAKSKKKGVEEPLPAETEPTFFDKMLEKIGF